MIQTLLAAFAMSILVCGLSSRASAQSLTAEEIRARLEVVLPNYFDAHRAELVRDQGPTNFFLQAQAATRAIQYLPVEQAIPLIVLGMGSYDVGISMAAEANLEYFRGPIAMKLFRAILLRDFGPIRAWVPEDFRSHPQMGEAAVRYFGNMQAEPDFKEVFDKTLKRAPGLHKLAEAVSNCVTATCFEIIKKHSKSGNGFIASKMVEALAGYSDSLEVFKIIYEHSDSANPLRRRAAVIASRRRTGQAYDNIIERATRAFWNETRATAYQGLRSRTDGEVFKIYREGLLDSSILVRYTVMNELAQRPEREAVQLLTRVRDRQIGRIRTNDEQMKLAPKKEIAAELFRQFRSSHSLESGNPSIAYLQTFDMNRRAKLRTIDAWLAQGLTEHLVAQMLLSARSNVTSPQSKNGPSLELPSLPSPPHQAPRQWRGGVAPWCESLFLGEI